MSENLLPLINGKLAVLYGGESAEREVSLESGQAIMSAMKKLGADFIGIDCKTADLAERLKAESISYCFIALHGGDGENGVIQALLKELGVQYTGGDAGSSALAMDKSRSKQVFKQAGLPTAASLVIERMVSWSYVNQQLGPKVMLKPVSEGSSIGMSIADDEFTFEQGIKNAFEYTDKVLVERWIEGTDYTVGILNDRALPSVRLETDRAFYDYEAKYLSDETRFFCPSGLTEEEEQQIQAIALAAFKSLGCSGWGRVDLMIDTQGSPNLLEVNTQPGMTSHSLVPLAAKAAGLSFEALVLKIMETAFQP